MAAVVRFGPRFPLVCSVALATVCAVSSCGSAALPVPDGSPSVFPRVSGAAGPGRPPVGHTPATSSAGPSDGSAPLARRMALAGLRAGADGPAGSPRARTAPPAAVSPPARLPPPSPLATGPARLGTTGGGRPSPRPARSSPACLGDPVVDGTDSVIDDTRVDTRVDIGIGLDTLGAECPPSS
ncbi:hypothetical protein FsymDg_0801 [Candidatus Protofrankia datiscae]|uniref:Uncharacterized protein n=1 Tax=Candidatus Protofrankia datiscae TaxID=2716812 RepID=F8B1R1_9ACTN|nr:hypothetical protein FsymDg_0801 [Candidatus Protofrankia datiscae]